MWDEADKEAAKFDGTTFPPAQHTGRYLGSVLFEPGGCVIAPLGLSIFAGLLVAGHKVVTTFFNNEQLPLLATLLWWLFVPVGGAIVTIFVSGKLIELYGESDEWTFVVWLIGACEVTALIAFVTLFL